MDDTRFYSFVPALYISQLQRGLQTAHAVSQMYADHAPFSHLTERLALFDQWAKVDKTIIICDALNAKGVVEVHKALQPFAARFKLPMTIFHEDADSLAGCPTATGIIVPKQFYDVKFEVVRGDRPGAGDHHYYTHTTLNADGTVKDSTIYHEGEVEFEFVALLKSYRLAQS